MLTALALDARTAARRGPRARAERARDLIVLRAHQVSGPALGWLLTLPSQEGLRVWLVSPKALPVVAQADDVAVSAATPVELDQIGGSHDRLRCRCEDLNMVAPLIPPVASARAGLSVDIAARLRRLYDIEAAALAAVLLGRPHPDELAAARAGVAADCPDHQHRRRNDVPGSGVRVERGFSVSGSRGNFVSGLCR